MDWIWFLPAGAALAALVILVRSLGALDAEAKRLAAEIARIPDLVGQGRSVDDRAASAEAARRATGDVLADRARH